MTARLVAIVLAGLAAGAAADLGLVDKPAGCAPHGLLDQGTLRGDGVFLAVVTRGCGDEGPVACTVADATSPIARETVPRGVAQDCVAFNQYVGAGLNQIPGYLTGECFSHADVAAPPRLPERRIHPRRRCQTP